MKEKKEYRESGQKIFNKIVYLPTICCEQQHLHHNV